jgi:hypothetical protein
VNGNPRSEGNLDTNNFQPQYLKPNQWMGANELSSNPDLKAFAQLAAQRGFARMASVTTAYRIAQLGGKRPKPHFDSSRSRLQYAPDEV